MMSSAGDGGNKGSDGSLKPSSGGEPQARPAEPPSGAPAAAGGPSNAPRPSSVAARAATAAASTAGKLAKELGGTTPIPEGTNLAFGFSTSLEKFAESQGAVSGFGAHRNGFLGIPIADSRVLRQFFDAVANTFIKNGGRIAFDLTGLVRDYMEFSVTGWELTRILKTKAFEAATDFFRNGERLTGAALEEALKPWRQ